MSSPIINQTVLMSGVEYFSDEAAINPYMHPEVLIDNAKAASEHRAIKEALESAGAHVTQVPAPVGCQDGVYTANWGLCRNGRVVLSSLPNKRLAEEPYAKKVLADLGFETIKPPYRFSGQGDALTCGDYLLAGSTYRTDPRVHQFIADQLGFEVISLQTIPALDQTGRPKTNDISGWPDSFFYDIDLAIAVLRPDLIAWCPEAFTAASQDKILTLPMDKIEVSYEEATQGFACNLISTGETVVMSAHAPEFKAAVEAKGLQTITPEVVELGKGGGYIRCIALTLDSN